MEFQCPIAIGEYGNSKVCREYNMLIISGPNLSIKRFSHMMWLTSKALKSEANQTNRFVTTTKTKYFVPFQNENYYFPIGFMKKIKIKHLDSTIIFITSSKKKIIQDILRERKFYFISLRF